MNKKLLKVLSICVIAGAISTGAAFGVAGCKKNNTEDNGKVEQTESTVTGVTITAAGSVTKVTVGSTLQLTATVAGTGSPSQAVTWSITEGGTNAEISTAGLVTGKAAGTVKVKATSVADTTKSAEFTLTVEAAETPAPATIDVTYELNADDLTAQTLSSNLTKSIFTIGSGTNIRNRTKNGVYANSEGGAQVSEAAYTKSIKLGGTNDYVEIYAPAAGTLTFHVQNGSSGTKTVQKLTLTKPDGSTEEITYYATDGSPVREVTLQFEAAGIYRISRTNGTSDIYYLKYTATVQNTPLSHIEISSDGVTDYLVGQDYSYDAVYVNKIYSETSRSEPLDLTASNVTVDTSAIDKTRAGVYDVTITYTPSTGENVVASPVLTKTFKVTYYAAESLSLGKNKIVSASNSYNGIYVNHHLQELYMAGDSFSDDGLTVTVNASVGTGTDKKSKSFIVSGGYTLTNNSASVMSATGKHTVTVSLDGDTSVSSTFDIYVMSKVDLSALTSVAVKVDAGTADSAVGTTNTDGAYQFKTIQQALKFLEIGGAAASATKTITLAAGTYTEKLEVNMPNVTIIGAGTDMTGSNYSKIEWDALYGLQDESGFVHTTDSTATLNVREEAVGFCIKGVVVSNAYNSKAYFDEKLGTGYSEHRALAALIQADKVVIDSCKFLGYQDTIEFFTGRQVVKNSLILGTTDFIFGTNNTTYFYKCEIRSIVAADSASHGGYITAFKGVNKTGTKVTYGAIFDDCDFTCEAGVSVTDTTAGTVGMTAIARPWGADAAVMVMNSRLGAHIATTAYNGGSRDTRYVSMSGNEPQNAQYYEYNNTGVGAITASQTYGGKNSVTVLTDATVAAKYKDFSVIFGTTNGEVEYSEAWDGTAGATITSKKINFAVTDYGTKTVSEYYAEDLTYDSTGVTDTAKLRFNDNSIQVQVGAKITLKTAGRVTVNWYGAPYGGSSNGVITYDANGYATITIVTSADGEKGVYIVSIEIDLTDIPAATTYSTVTYNSNYGETPTTETVQAINGNKLTQPTDPTRSGYTFAGWYTAANESGTAFDFANTVITADVTLYAHWTAGVTATLYDTETSVDMTGCTDTYQYGGTTSGAYNGILIDASTEGAKFANNNSGWIQFNVGIKLKIKVAEGAVITVKEYQDAGKVNVSAIDSDGYITITTTENTYISVITISYPVDFTVANSLDLSTCTTKYEGTTGTYRGVQIDATSGKLASNGNWAQFNKGTKIKIKVAAGATVTVVEYNNAGNITISKIDSDGYVTITATDNTYISVITVTYAS